MRVGVMGIIPKTHKGQAIWRLPTPKDKKSETSEVECGDNDRIRSICFDVNGIAHRKLVLPNQTVNQQFGIFFLRYQQEDVWRKFAEIWQSGDWFFHHDNPLHIKPFKQAAI